MKDKLAEEILKKHIATIVKTGDKEYDDFYRKSIEEALYFLNNFKKYMDLLDEIESKAVLCPVFV